MNANLVRAAGARLDTAKREAAKSLDHLVIAARLLAVFFSVGDHHLLALVHMLGDPPFDVVAVAIQHPGLDGLVFFENLARLELKAQIPMALLFFGDEDHATGVAVEAVDDAGPILAAGLA